jgi:hypothetical protein
VEKSFFETQSKLNSAALEKDKGAKPPYITRLK